MKGRRSVALLCVLLMHAWLIHVLLNEFAALELLNSIRGGSWNMSERETDPITLNLDMDLEPPVFSPELEFEESLPGAQVSAPAPSPGFAAPDESSAITPPARVDWPLEGKKAAARVLAREAEAERVAMMFAGPGGTWASLTKRQRSRLNKFRFKDGVDGLEYDAQGNQIVHISDGCMIVNSGFIACKIGKVKVRGDMFENMRQYFDELRLPDTPEGNGTEPEALRPPY